MSENCVENCENKTSKKRVFQIKSRHDLVDNVLEIWTSLTPTYIKSLHVSLPKRIWAVLGAYGCITEYWKFGVSTFINTWKKPLNLTVLLLAKFHHVSHFVTFNFAFEYTFQYTFSIERERERANGFKTVNSFLKEVVFFEILKYSLVYSNICIVIIHLNIPYKNSF